MLGMWPVIEENVYGRVQGGLQDAAWPAETQLNARHAVMRPTSSSLCFQILSLVYGWVYEGCRVLAE